MDKRRRMGMVIGMSVVLILGYGVSGVQAQSGSLEPPGSAVDGSGNPVATTQTQPSWDQDLPATERFKLVLGGEAVLDKETGLVWPKQPGTGSRTWSEARYQCANSSTNGKKGWRLPSMHELTSLLVRLTSPQNPLVMFGLPPGHPFNLSSFIPFWTATTNSENPATVWSVSSNGQLAFSSKSQTLGVWCVRGGGPLSEY